MATTQKRFRTLDLYQSAFLTFSGIHPTLEVEGSKVVFSFPIGDELYRLLSNYAGNVSVPVSDYVTTLKALKGQMLTMREGVRR